MTLEDRILSIFEENVFYHVAHPNIPCKVLTILDSRWANVRFDEPVEFSGNPYRSKTRNWSCSANLLFESSDEARANHDPKRAKAQSLREQIDREVP